MAAPNEEIKNNKIYKRMKKYLTLLAGAMFLTACSNDAEDIAGNNGYQPSTDAIAFEINGDGVENATRASGAIYSDDVLATSSISVFASYTGKLRYENTTVKQDFMWNQKVTGTGTAPDITWTYNPVKYWPNGLADTPEYLSFFAYAPYKAKEELVDDGRGGIIDISANDITGDPWINYRIASKPWDVWDYTDADPANWNKTEDANQVDLLYGTKYTPASGANPEKWESWTNVSKYKDDGTINTDVAGIETGSIGKVKFTMKHALASIGNAITIRTSGELNGLIKNYSEIIVEGIKIEYKNLTNKARLILNSADGSANWKEVISGELTTTRTYLNMFKPANQLTFDGTPSTDLSIAPNSDPKHIHYLNAAAAADGVPAAESIEGDGLFYIPLQIAGQPKATATVTLYYRVHILGPDIYKPAIGTAPAEATSKTFELDNNLEGKMQGIALTLGKDYDLLHEVWTLGGTATEPSYSRELK